MKKVFALLLTIVMLATLVACNGGGETTAPTATTANSEAPANESAAPSEAPLTAGEFALPITDQLTEFSIWSEGGRLGTAGLTDWNESLGYQELEKRTNIHINWQLAAAGSEAEQFNLMCASENYPDGIYATVNLMSSGIQSYVDNEIIIDLTDYIKMYAPNYQAVRTADEDIRRRTVTDMGTFPVFFKIKKTVEPSWAGVVTRNDWLKQLGEKNPKTYDDYHNLLLRYKNELNVEIPLATDRLGRDSFFMADYDLASGSLWTNPYMVVDGQVQYPPIQPAFLDYLTMMNQWFNEGLIDPEFYTREKLVGSDYSLVSTGKVGMFGTATSFIDMAAANSTTEGYELIAIEPPVRNVGDKRKVLISSPYHRFENGVGAISTSCKDPITLTKYFDYFYTEEGSLLANWGIEGVSYTMVDGKPQFAEVITNNPDGIALATARIPYICQNINAMLYDWSWSMTSDMSQNARESGSIWDKNWEDSLSFPTVALSAEESSVYARVMGDVGTYIDEMVVKFIIGTEPLTNFDKFCQNIKNLGIDEAIAVQQAGYDRFMSR